MTDFDGVVPGFDAEQHEVMLALMADLRYPVGPRGEVFMMLDAMKPIVSYHLTRCGWRPITARRRIKARKVIGRGVMEDAVTWVGMHEPDDPLAGLGSMTLNEIELLPEDAKIEAARRLGLPVAPPEPLPGWQTQTRININDEEDQDDFSS